MKYLKWLYLLCLVFSIHNFCAGQNSAESISSDVLGQLAKDENSMIGEPFPTFTYNSKTWTSKEFFNKITLVNFWFASCKPCLLEFGSLNKLNSKLDSNRFKIVSVTFENDSTIYNIQQRFALNFPVLSISKEEFSRLLRFSGCPLNVIVNNEGNVRFWRSGGKPTQVAADQYMLKDIFSIMLDVDKLSGL